MSQSNAPRLTEEVRTGIDGLDRVLGGGLAKRRIYLIEGTPGTGKTTLALHFLREGASQRERTLYVTLSETKDELRDVAMSHGWSLDGIDLYELEAMEDLLNPDEQYTVFHPAEVELGRTTKRICERVESIQPIRVVLDSLSEMRLIAQNPLRYRREILALKQFFKGRNCTVLLLDDGSSGKDDMQLASITHGVIGLDQHAGEYGPMRRRLLVQKMRGQSYLEGYHDFAIRSGGITVYPQLTPSQRVGPLERETLASGVPELDLLTGGGLDMGSSVLVLGPSGAGKSVMATQYCLAAARNRKRVKVYLFEESIESFLHRARSLGMDLKRDCDEGRVDLERIDPARLSPGEFVCKVRDAVEGGEARMVIIDSLNGYLNAVPSERVVLIQLHELLTYLSQQGVLTIIVLVQHGLVGGAEAQIDLSYLADTVLLLRYFEAAGSVRQAIAVIKKRSGIHERTIRELNVGAEGLRIGRPLREFAGVLSGAPQYRGSEELFEVEKSMTNDPSGAQ